MKGRRLSKSLKGELNLNSMTWNLSPIPGRATYSRSGQRLGPGLALMAVLTLTLNFCLAFQGQAEGNDLSLDPLTVSPSEPEEGDRILVAFVVRNEGAKVEQVLVEGHVNNRMVMSRYFVVEEDNATAFSFSFELDSKVAIVTVVVDPDQDLNDTDRSNNHQVFPIEVPEDERQGLIWTIVGLAVLGGGLVAYLYVRNNPGNDGPASSAGDRTADSTTKKEGR